MIKLASSLLLLFFAYVYGQKNNLSFELRSKYGFLIAHRPVMSHLPKEHLKSLEFNVLHQTSGKKSWHQAFNYPVIGVSSLVTNAGNKNILGFYGGTLAFIQFKTLNSGNSQIITRIGGGIGYTNKVFNQETNPKNVAMSTHFNALVNLSVYYQYTFKRNHFNFGLDLTHFSNGGTKMPNLGVNLAYLSLGYARRFKELEKIEQNFKEVDHSWKYTAVAIITQRGTFPTGENKFPVIALSLGAQKAFKYSLGFESGVDLMYKPSIRKYKPVIPKSAESMVQIGMYSTYFISLDKMQIHIGMGVYLRDEYYADDRFYHRMGFKYTCNNGLMFNLTLKSHWAKADYIEYGIGYRF